MIPISILLFLLAFALSGKSLLDSYRSRIAELEREWVELYRNHLSKEFLFIDASQIRRAVHLILLFGFLLSFLMVSIFPLLIAFLIAWVIPMSILRLIQQNRRKKFEKQFARVLPEIASILRAGHTFERALKSLVQSQPNPLSQELELVLKEIQLGTTIDQALQNLLARFPSRNLEILIRAISISRRVGSNLAEAFSKVSEMIEARNALRDRLMAMTAQGKAQAGIAIVMPIVLLCVLQMYSPDYLVPLFHTTIGQLVLAACVVMTAVGGFWIYKICSAELIQ